MMLRFSHDCRLGLDDAQLEQLEEQLEHQLAKNEIAAFAKEASESIDTYKKRCSIVGSTGM